MKFDCVVMNPPYQSSQDNKGKRGGGTSLWDKFVNIAIDNLVEDEGYLCAVHPCGWRNPVGRYKDAKKCITDNRVCYLEIHNAQDGQKVFGAGTRYDWYVLQKAKPVLTIIKSEDGSIHKLNINNISFLPHGEFDKVFSLVAKEGEDKCEVLYSRSAYESRKEWMSKEQTDVFKYPVVHSIKKEGLNLLWSSKEISPDFARPKIIFGCGQSRTYIDFEGKYGLSQHTRALVADKEDLKNINKALNNEKLIDLMKNCVYISTSQFIDKYDKNVLALFRKDFWKEFI